MGLFSWFFGGGDPKDVAQIDNPATIFEEPSDVVGDATLTHDEKKKALSDWEQDCPSAHDREQRGNAGTRRGP
jgi:hypothetical protein